MAIFNSYVKLPEGNGIEEWLFSKILGIEWNSERKWVILTMIDNQPTKP